jgi:hypothetical protein
MEEIIRMQQEIEEDEAAKLAMTANQKMVKFCGSVCVPSVCK